MFAFSFSKQQLKPGEEGKSYNINFNTPVGAYFVINVKQHYINLSLKQQFNSWSQDPVA